MLLIPCTKCVFITKLPKGYVTNNFLVCLLRVPILWPVPVNSFVPADEFQMPAYKVFIGWLSLGPVKKRNMYVI